jgi:hypothetical protein
MSAGWIDPRLCTSSIAYCISLRVAAVRWLRYMENLPVDFGCGSGIIVSCLRSGRTRSGSSV